MWQLRADGVPRAAIRHGARELRVAFDGVYVSGHAPPTTRQRLLAAAYTAPGTWVDRWSAAHAYGLWSRGDGPVCVVRSGSGGPRRSRGNASDLALALSARRSLRLPAVDCLLWQGVPMLSPSRTVLDLLGLLRSPAIQERLVRDALRLRVVDARALHQTLALHRGRRGVGALRALVEHYARLPVSATRSDAEAEALSILAAAGLPLPRVNVLVRGHEADLVWPAQRLIVELDSNEYHPFPERDEQKQQRWESGGWRVERLGVHIPASAPWQLIDVVRAALAPSSSR